MNRAKKARSSRKKLNDRPRKKLNYLTPNEVLKSGAKKTWTYKTLYYLILKKYKQESCKSNDGVILVINKF